MSVADDILAKAILPTHLSSAEIQAQIAADIRRRAIFSARTTQAGYLRRLQEILADIAAGRINDADARAALQRALDQAGYTPATGFPAGHAGAGIVQGDLRVPAGHAGAGIVQGDLRVPAGHAGAGIVQGDLRVPAGHGLTDLSSRRRLDLILTTNRLATASVAMAQADTPDTLAAYPAWQLERYLGRRVPRADWWQRWRSAADAVGWEGVAPGVAMIALKSSPIWQALGDGAGGYTDTLGNPYPPFAFNSGLAWTPVSAAAAQAAGLTSSSSAGVHTGHAAPPHVSLSPGQREIRDALHRLGPDFTADLIAELEGAA